MSIYLKSAVLMFLVTGAIVGVGGVVFTKRHEVLALTHVARVGELRVVAKSDSILDGWDVSLCWRRKPGPWMIYYLAHESSFWADVAIRSEGEALVITQAGRVMGRLFPNTGAFEHATTGVRYAEPIALLFAEHPMRASDRRLSPESPGWGEVLAKVRGETGTR